ncbi:MAG TPA: helix-turn-helix domain-containing protein [Devosiaceae bacterium]
MFQGNCSVPGQPEEPPHPFPKTTNGPRRRLDPQTSAVLRLVSADRGIGTSMLLHGSRCCARVARSRQLAMYLLHVVHRRTLTDIGEIFDRDRTTVAHACARIEDMRDDRIFDADVSRLETLVGESLAVSRTERHAG